MIVDLNQLGIDRLSIPERMELIGLIWDSIDAGGPSFSPPEWHLDEIKQRIAAADKNSAESISLEELQARIARQP